MEELLLGLRALSVGTDDPPPHVNHDLTVSSDSDDVDPTTIDLVSDSDSDDAAAPVTTEVQPTDPSLLWTHGGNVQRQRWHRDLPEGTRDWMLWLPLSDSGRDLHVVVNDKAQLLHVPYGTGLLLRGDIVHAGAASESANTANFAFHVYLTSNTSTPSSTLLDAVKQQYAEEESTTVVHQMTWTENNGVIVAQTFTVANTLLGDFSQKAVAFALNQTNCGRWKGLMKHTKTTRYRDADVCNPKSGGRHNAVFSVSEDGFVWDFTISLLQQANVKAVLAGVSVTIAARMIPTGANLILRLLCTSTLSDIHRNDLQVLLGCIPPKPLTNSANWGELISFVQLVAYRGLAGLLIELFSLRGGVVNRETEPMEADEVVRIKTKLRDIVQPSWSPHGSMLGFDVAGVIGKRQPAAVFYEKINKPDPGQTQKKMYGMWCGANEVGMCCYTIRQTDNKLDGLTYIKYATPEALRSYKTQEEEPARHLFGWTEE